LISILGVGETKKGHHPSRGGKNRSTNQTKTSGVREERKKHLMGGLSGGISALKRKGKAHPEILDGESGGHIVDFLSGAALT